MKKSIIYITLLFFTFSSCKKFLDVNENPNSPTTAPINGLLGQVTYQSALNVFRVGNITANYVQYLASPNAASPSDIYEPIDASSTWTNLYNIMTDIYDLEKLGTSSGSSEHRGVAKVLMALNLKMVHDLWGNAPYAEAFTSLKLTPVFDDAQSLYNRCITLVDEGIVLLQQTNSAFALSTTLDFIHKGNKAAWIKTANALKARLLMLVSKRTTFNANNVIAALSNSYTSNNDDAAINAFDIRNPWAQVAQNNAVLLLGGWLSKQYVDMMNGTIYGIFDPRLPLIASITRFNDYRGTRNGAGRVGNGTSMEESYISTTGYYSSNTSPLFIITYSEVKFLEAEARFRKGGDLPAAYAAYIEGIRANMNKLGVSTASRDAYVNDASVSVGAANLTLALILKEKYKSIFLNPETWNDARRNNYNYQGFALPQNAALGTYIRRLDYPNVEITRNGINVPSVSGLDQKLWWDQ